MKIRYIWFSKKVNRKQHLLGENNLTLCSAENGNVRLDTVSETEHPTRAICAICTHMLTKAGKKKRQAPPKPKSDYRDSFLHTREWKAVRYMALKRSKGHCECCGRSPSDGAVMNVDHIKSRRDHPELALTVSNLQVLCSWCNHGKGADDSTDWREPSLRVIMGERVD
jgi:hypothetical protein